MVSSRFGEYRGAVNLALNKRERVTMGCKGRGEIENETGKIIGMVADASTVHSLAKRRYGVFDGLDMYANIKESDMGGGDGSGKLDRIETVERSPFHL